MYTQEVWIQNFKEGVPLRRRTDSFLGCNTSYNRAIAPWGLEPPTFVIRGLSPSTFFIFYFFKIKDGFSFSLAMVMMNFCAIIIKHLILKSIVSSKGHR